jgi:hypothetical protein
MELIGPISFAQYHVLFTYGRYRHPLEFPDIRSIPTSIVTLIRSYLYPINRQDGLSYSDIESRADSARLARECFGSMDRVPVIV